MFCIAYAPNLNGSISMGHHMRFFNFFAEDKAPPLLSIQLCAAMLHLRVAPHSLRSSAAHASLLAHSDRNHMARLSCP